MAKSFKRVVRYQCQWCGNVFKTDRLHSCKFDPDKRNCLSCVHQHGRDVDPEDDLPYYVCDTVDNGTKFCDIGTIALNNWNGECPEYETVPGWKGKETFKARRAAAEGGNRADA